MRIKHLVICLVWLLGACGGNISGPGYLPVHATFRVNDGQSASFLVTSAFSRFDEEGNPTLRIHYRGPSLEQDGSEFSQTFILKGQAGVIGERVDLTAPGSTMTEERIPDPNTPDQEVERLMEADAVTGWIQFDSIYVEEGFLAPSHAMGTFTVTYTETSTGESRTIENAFFHF